jgi:hypothetical protein
MHVMPTRATRRAVFSFSCFAIAIAAIPSAHAAAGPTRDQCITAADEGQKLRDDGKLSAAREKFLVCASKSCPGPVAKACAGWRDDADRDMPSATFRISDEHGKELMDVKIMLDGSATPQTLTAKAIPLDPGEHKIKVERADGKTLEDKFLLRPGEKNRLVDLTFQPPNEPQVSLTAPPPPKEPEKPPPPQESNFHVPMLGWVGLGVGVAGAATMTIFAVMANGDANDVRSSNCAPACPSSQKDSINTKLTVANVGMGVGIVGLGVAVVTTVLANTGSPKKTGAITVDAGPQSIWLRGSF